MQHAPVTLCDSRGKDLKKNLTWQKRIKSHADCIVPHWKHKVIVSSPSNKLGHPSRWSYFVLKITKSRCTQYFTLQSRGAWLSLHETSTTSASKGKQTGKQMQQPDTRPFTVWYFPSTCILEVREGERCEFHLPTHMHHTEWWASLVIMSN